MSSQAIKTNNDPAMIDVKVMLRLKSLPNKQNIYVLDAYGGEGTLWQKVKKQTDKNINILGIDKNSYNKIQLQGDNLKFLKSLDLSKFDIIDLDAWGSPCNQLEMLSKRKYKGIVHVTFIQSGMGRINNKLLYAFGYTKQMINKCPTLLCKNGIDKIKNYIAKTFNVRKINISEMNRKYYFYFVIN
jgi:hypothetical protein